MAAAEKQSRDPSKDDHHVTKINREEEWWLGLGSSSSPTRIWETRDSSGAVISTQWEVSTDALSRQNNGSGKHTSWEESTAFREVSAGQGRFRVSRVWWRRRKEKKKTTAEAVTLPCTFYLLHFYIFFALFFYFHFFFCLSVFFFSLTVVIFSFISVLFYFLRLGIFPNRSHRVTYKGGVHYVISLIPFTIE